MLELCSPFLEVSYLEPRQGHQVVLLTGHSPKPIKAAAMVADSARAVSKSAKSNERSGGIKKNDWKPCSMGFKFRAALQARVQAARASRYLGGSSSSDGAGHCLAGTSSDSKRQFLWQALLEIESAVEKVAITRGAPVAERACMIHPLRSLRPCTTKRKP